MNRSSTDQGQRVNEPTAVSGDAADIGEQDPQQLKDKMAQAGKGSDAKLKDAEAQAEGDAIAVKPAHRENDAGQ